MTHYRIMRSSKSNIYRCGDHLYTGSSLHLWELVFFTPSSLYECPTTPDITISATTSVTTETTTFPIIGATNPPTTQAETTTTRVLTSTLGQNGKSIKLHQKKALILSHFSRPTVHSLWASSKCCNDGRCQWRMDSVSFSDLQ